VAFPEKAARGGRARALEQRESRAPVRELILEELKRCRVIDVIPTWNIDYGKV
jgi:hypothetical protein